MKVIFKYKSGGKNGCRESKTQDQEERRETGQMLRLLYAVKEEEESFSYSVLRAYVYI